MTGAEQGPVAHAQMLIRNPVAQVFEAFVDPAVTSRFWFTKGSGRLQAGKQIRHPDIREKTRTTGASYRRPPRVSGNSIYISSRIPRT